MNQEQLINTLLQRQVFLQLADLNDPVSKATLKLTDEVIASACARYGVDLNLSAVYMAQKKPVGK